MVVRDREENSSKINKEVMTEKLIYKQGIFIQNSGEQNNSLANKIVISRFANDHTGEIVVAAKLDLAKCMIQILIFWIYTLCNESK